MELQGGYLMSDFIFVIHAKGSVTWKDEDGLVYLITDYKQEHQVAVCNL